MHPNFPVRQFIQQTLKTFPWSYSNQETTLLELLDGLLANRLTSWNGIARWSLIDITVKKFWYLCHNGYTYLQNFHNWTNNEFNTIDHRNTFYLSIDDTSQQRFGSKVYGASIFKDHSNSGYMNGNVLVNCYVHSQTYLESSYLQYISEKYLKKVNDTTYRFQTKIELGKAHFQTKIKQLIDQGVANDKIWLTMDAWYISEDLIALTKEWRINYLVGIKKNAVCCQFGTNFSLDQLFARDDPWSYITVKKSGSTLYYKTKTLYFPKYGRCKVFAIKRAQEKRIHYYLTNDLKMTIQTFNNRWKHHWQIERFHFYTKDYFGLEESYSGTKNANHFQWLLSHVIYKLFWVYRNNLRINGVEITFERLWELYCLEYDFERSKQLVFSRKKHNFLIRKVEAF